VHQNFSSFLGEVEVFPDDLSCEGEALFVDGWLSSIEDAKPHHLNFSERWRGCLELHDPADPVPQCLLRRLVNEGL
jgi:hypothetical protein